jgi:hypothetical protein
MKRPILSNSTFEAVPKKMAEDDKQNADALKEGDDKEEVTDISSSLSSRKIRKSVEYVES